MQGIAARDLDSRGPWGQPVTLLGQVPRPGPGLCRFKFSCTPLTDCTARRSNQRAILRAKHEEKGNRAGVPGASVTLRPALARNKTRGKQKGCVIPRWVCASATSQDTADTSPLQPQTYAPLAPWRALLVPGRRGRGMARPKAQRVGRQPRAAAGVQGAGRHGPGTAAARLPLVT